MLLAALTRVHDTLAARLSAPRAAGATFASAASLGGGSAGAIVFFAQHAEAFGRVASRDLAFHAIDHAVEAAEDLPASLSLLDGVVGLAWAVRHASVALGRPELAGLASPIDVALRDALSSPLDAAPLDLTSGLTGLGQYLLDWGGPSGFVALRRIVDVYRESAVSEPVGVFWPAERTRGFAGVASRGVAQDEGLADSGAPIVDLGLAHGVPGLLVFLARANRRGIHASEMLRRGSRWLLNQRRDRETGPAFAYARRTDGQLQRPTGLAWCYGDLAVCTALASVDQAAPLSRSEVAIARETARVAPVRTPPRDLADGSAFCHGAAGTAHILRELGSYWRVPELQRQAARRLRQLAEILVEADLEDPTLDTRLGIEGLGLLSGWSGVGLALMTAVAEPRTRWQHVLLLP